MQYNCYIIIIQHY